MTVTKRSGMAPDYSNPTRREVRAAVRSHDRDVIADTVASEKAKLAGAAQTELAAIGDVRSLSREDYQAVRRRALRLTRTALDPKP
jgi:hypothetical protein